MECVNRVHFFVFNTTAARQVVMLAAFLGLGVLLVAVLFAVLKLRGTPADVQHDEDVDQQVCRAGTCIPESGSHLPDQSL